MSEIKKPSFEENFELINSLLEKRKHKWHLNALVWMDWQDVKQIILIHIHKKWNLYDPNYPLPPWINKIISHQISNLIRNHYSSFSRPCLQCSCNEGNDLCSIYKTQNSSCPLFARWEKTKKRAHNVKMAVSIENHAQEISDRPDENVDISKATENMHKKMEEILTKSEFRVYRFLYIIGLSEEATAEKCGFITGELMRKKGYARIQQIKKKIWETANKIKDEIDFF